MTYCFRRQQQTEDPNVSYYFFVLKKTSVFQVAWLIDFERSVVQSERLYDKCEGLPQMTNFLSFMIVLAPGLLTFGWPFGEESSTVSH